MNKRAWLIAAAIVVLVLAVGGWWFFRPHTPPSASPAVPPGNDEVLAPAPVGTVETYAQNLAGIIAPLNDALAKKDDAALLAAAGAARPQLMALVVPAGKRDQHLALVLAVSQLVQAGQSGNADLAPERAGLKSALKPFQP